MKKYKVKIGYIVSFDMYAKNKKEAKELAWFEFDQLQKDEDLVKMNIKEIK